MHFFRHFDQKSLRVLPFEQVAKKLHECETSWLSFAEIEEHLKLMTEILPQFCAIKEIGNRGKFFELNKKLELNFLLEKIQEEKSKILS